MKNAILALVLAVVIGGSTAIYRPAVPYQVPAAEINPSVFVPRGGAAFFDAGLDNDEIEADGNITPDASVVSAWDDPDRPIVQ
eukprot:CAMPEP_0201125580 /NCGR_PEP_ID=MMETSP0850-20130426/21957_1 /ASSEMBLY_ACC=CAM_ASM_000622 /TAXON_ID=183588 /ORGANISM="Pseudo-nitzschia fraudulenta, Strain WWA7" /LENGTH=82 /DNA_ID=CAMNT_0047393663 /DNA_START=134 /DNA_END=383 /DNA_ORIENTATION=-